MISKKLGMVIDQERCIGCETCTVACNIEHNAFNPWINVEVKIEGKFPDNVKMEFMPELCNHCTDPRCKDACPTEAIIKREDGIVIVDEDKCDACQLCKDVCPYGVIVHNRQKEIIEKCNFCADRIDEGLDPFCVVCCEGQALHFGDLNDPNSEVSQIIANKKTFQLHLEKETRPNVYYCPPKPRRKL